MTTIGDSLKGLVNSITGVGTTRDKARGAEWSFAQNDPLQLEYAYRSNWMCRKAVDIPAFDMLRRGWCWQAEKDMIEAIEAEERRHKIRSKLLEGFKLARLYGGAAIIVSDGSSDPGKELNFETIQQGGLSFMTVVDRHALSSGNIIFDPMSEYYGQPTHYQLLSLGSMTSIAQIHPSRVIRIVGAPIPKPNRQIADQWGDSILEAVDLAIQDATQGQAGIATLIAEAKVDVVKVPGLTEKVSTQTYQDALQTRFELANRLKSYINAYVMDAEEEYEQKQINFSNLPDVQRILLQIVSGAVDIPATRFLSQSPAGLSSTGESDLRNYYDRIQSEQELILRPVHERVEELIVRSALGDFPDEVHFEYEPLWQPTAAERADIAKKRSEEVNTYANSGLVPDIVLEKAVRNRLIESGDWPGIEGAYDDFDAEGGFDLLEEERRQQAELAMRGQAASVAAAEAGAAGGGTPAQQTGDAKPRTMYVYRKVKNAAEIIAWARSQGISDTLAAADLHVTIAFSRAPVDWFDFREDYEPEITIKGGARALELFGPKNDVIVLLFKSNLLHWRHREFTEGGARWDWPDYEPHISITWNAAGVDVSKIDPYQGEIVLGPEHFEEVKEKWASMLDARPSEDA